MRPLLIVATGTPPPEIRARHGVYADWFLHALRWPRAQARVVQVDHGDRLPAPRELAGAVITGSAAMVSERAPWSERTAAWLRGAMDADLPLFGVCYGHHLLAHALGGRVDYHPQGREIGTQMIQLLTADTALRTLVPLPAQFPAHTTHLQSVLEVPQGARVLARSAHDAHHILAYGTRAFSTQFHPEFSTAVMRALILRRAADLRAEAYDLDALLQGVRPTPWARRLLRGFARLCRGAAAGSGSSDARAAA